MAKLRLRYFCFMSSHHIVREKQEPALLIISLARFDSEHLGQLLEWSPTVFASDKVYEQADHLGIKIDGVITGNPDFVAQSDSKLVFSQGNHIEDGIKYFISENYPALNIIAEDFHLKEYALFTEFINLVIFTGNQKIFPVTSGFSKWKAAGDKVTLLHEVRHLQISNLSHLTEHDLQVEHDGFYSICFDQPFTFIAEEIY